VAVAASVGLGGAVAVAFALGVGLDGDCAGVVVGPAVAVGVTVTLGAADGLGKPVGVIVGEGVAGAEEHAAISTATSSWPIQVCRPPHRMTT
jgi:hypothetical protein